MVIKTLDLLSLFIYVIVSCYKNPVSIDSKDNFSIHFLKDLTITIDQLQNLNLSDVKFDPTPWLSSKDIEFYDYSTHFIYLKTSFKDFFPDFNDSNVNIEDWHFKPFVVCAFKKASYAGCLHLSICSHWRFDVFIMDRDVDENDDNDILRIGNSTPSIFAIPQSSEDVRNNINIKNALIKDGIYHAGLEVKLNDVTILENTDTAIVQYSFTITNNDQDNLYVINSEVMDKEIFDLAITLIFIDEFDQGIRPIGYKSSIDHDILVN